MAIIPSALIQITRGLINDLTASSYVYTDTRLEELISISAYLVVNEVDFSTSYTINVDLQQITPSPSLDMNFMALVGLRTACMVLQGDYITDSTKAISVKDGPSTIDMRARIDHKKIIAETACKKYENAKIRYVAGDRSVGVGIVGPYNSGGSSSQNTFN